MAWVREAKAVLVLDRRWPVVVSDKAAPAAQVLRHRPAVAVSDRDYRVVQVLGRLRQVAALDRGDPVVQVLMRPWGAEDSGKAALKDARASNRALRVSDNPWRAALGLRDPWGAWAAVINPDPKVLRRHARWKAARALDRIDHEMPVLKVVVLTHQKDDADQADRLTPVLGPRDADPVDPLSPGPVPRDGDHGVSRDGDHGVSRDGDHGVSRDVPRDAGRGAPKAVLMTVGQAVSKDAGPAMPKDGADRRNREAVPKASVRRQVRTAEVLGKPNDPAATAIFKTITIVAHQRQRIHLTTRPVPGGFFVSLMSKSQASEKRPNTQNTKVVRIPLTLTATFPSIHRTQVMGTIPFPQDDLAQLRTRSQLAHGPVHPGHVASMRIASRFVRRWPEHPCLSPGMGAGVG